jgi:hypothetical protein
MPERTSPRISLNKLGEYLVANPVRRRRIISDQKNPSDFIVARYREAVDPIVRFISSGAQNEQIIHDAIKQINSRPIASDWQEQDAALSIEALTSFLDIADQVPVKGFTYSAGEQDAPKLTISGVEVSVRPELVVLRQVAGGYKVGAFKVYVVKRYPLTIGAAAYVGAVLQKFAAEKLTARGVADYSLCGVIDVFAGKIHIAPRAYQNRLAQVEAACEEIARAWPTA